MGLTCGTRLGHHWPQLPGEAAMKKILTCLMSALLVGLPVLLTATSAGADDKEKEKDEDRLKNCGTVLKDSGYSGRCSQRPARQSRLRGRFSFRPPGRVRDWRG